MIGAVGFTTRGRPIALERCMRSFVENLRAYGRSPQLIVLDDGGDAAYDSAYPIAARIAAEFPEFEVLYAGLEQKRDLVEQLSRAGIDHAVAEFALLDPERCGYTLGANRNALQLETLGEQVLYVDDDSEALTARPPAWDERLLVSGHSSNQEYWYYPSHRDAVAAASFEAADLLALHESFLGRSGREIVDAYARGPGVLELAGPWPTGTTPYALWIGWLPGHDPVCRRPDDRL